ncbi:Cell division protein sepF, partial [Candidatus Arthromitus sp. SFB-5]
WGKVRDSMALKNAAEKVWGFFGLKDEYEDSLEKEIKQNNDDEIFSMNKQNNTMESQNLNGKVVNLHTGNSLARMTIIKPVAYEEVLGICDDLKNRKIVIVNATILEPKVAQRTVDFLCGASYALDAEFQEVEKSIYILAPSNVEVTNELKKRNTN